MYLKGFVKLSYFLNVYNGLEHSDYDRSENQAILADKPSVEYSPGTDSG